MGINDKNTQVPDVTIEDVMKQCKWTRETAQIFIDISIEKGMVIPLGGGLYRVVSIKAIEEAKDILNQRRA